MDIFIPNGLYWAFALLASLYCGYYCFEIHPLTSPNKNNWGTKVNDLEFGLKTGYNKHYEFIQFITNFLGAFIGWIALYFFLPHNLVWSNPSQFSWQHLILVYIAYVGITGNLPFVTKFFKN